MCCLLHGFQLPSNPTPLEDRSQGGPFGFHLAGWGRVSKETSPRGAISPHNQIPSFGGSGIYS